MDKYAFSSGLKDCGWMDKSVFFLGGGLTNILCALTVGIGGKNEWKDRCEGP